MAYTQDDLARLQRAYADGAKSVTLADGSRTDYRDLAELKRAIDTVQADLNAAAGASPRRRGVVTHTTKGVY